MNLKSDILKLSIIFMLILVMIPVATAMDSDDAFYIEHDYPDEEQVIEEYGNFEVEDTQVDVSFQPSDEEVVDDSLTYEYGDEVQHSHEEVVDAVEVPELYDDSDVVTHNIDVSQENEVKCYDELTSKDLDDIITYHINETSSDDLTLEEISVDVQGLFIISKIDIIYNYFDIIYEVFNNEITTSGAEMHLGKNFYKVLELKNILLTNEEIQNNLDCHQIADLDDSLDVCINKITNDFAYCIDNSIVGDAHGIIIVITKSSFSTFYPCFDATFSRDFLNVEYFFGGGFSLIAAEYFFETCFVEYNDLSNIDYNVKFFFTVRR